MKWRNISLAVLGVLIVFTNGRFAFAQPSWEVSDSGYTEKIESIVDPLEPYNRAIYLFNDKVYFYLLKPVAKGYKAVLPEFTLKCRHAGTFCQLYLAGKAEVLGRRIGPIHYQYHLGSSGPF